MHTLPKPDDYDVTLSRINEYKVAFNEYQREYRRLHRKSPTSHLPYLVMPQTHRFKFNIAINPHTLWHVNGNRAWHYGGFLEEKGKKGKQTLERFGVHFAGGGWPPWHMTVQEREVYHEDDDTLLAAFHDKVLTTARFVWYGGFR